MNLLAPAMLWWGVIALAAASLYLFRPRPRKERVSTLLFFQTLAKAHQESAWLRRLKRLLSLLLTLLIIAAGVLALSRWIIAPKADGTQHVVVLLDRSASMAATDDAGRSRLEDARDQILQRLDALEDGVAVSVIAYDVQPEVLLPRSLDRREVRRALDAVRVRPMAGDHDPALRLARELALLDAPASIWHASDDILAAQAIDPDDAAQPDAPPPTPDITPVRNAADAASPVSATQPQRITVVPIHVALPDARNVGITGFEMRKVPMQPDQYDAFVEVRASQAIGNGQPIEAELTVKLEGQLVTMRKLSLARGERKRLLLPLKAGVSQTLSLELQAEGDRLQSDDVLLARVPPAKPIRVLWISGKSDPFTELALSVIGSDGSVQVLAGGPEQWPPPQSQDGSTQDQAIDVVVFQGWLPETWPTDMPVVVMDPPQSLGPVQVRRLEGNGLPLDTLRSPRGRHPLLLGVATGRVAVRQVAVVDADPRLSGLEPIWVGPAGPVMAAGDLDGQRVVVMAFDASRSESLPLMASFPLLMGNTLYWASEPASRREAGENLQSGELVMVPQGSLIWTDADAGVESSDQDDITLGQWKQLDRIGLWQTTDGRIGSSALLSAAETNLPAAPETAASTANSGSTWSNLLTGDMTALLIALLLGFLLIESYLFHRHAVY